MERSEVGRRCEEVKEVHSAAASQEEDVTSGRVDLGAVLPYLVSVNV